MYSVSSRVSVSVEGSYIPTFGPDRRREDHAAVRDGGSSSEVSVGVHVCGDTAVRLDRVEIIGERRGGARRQERDDEREASGSSDRHAWE
jgi:hypothetical protein